jgi:hypothetical protein
MTIIQGTNPLALVLVVGAVVLLAKFWASGKGGKPSLSYIEKSIMTVAEMRFFRVLQMAVPNDLVFPQVSMAAVIEPGNTKSYSEHMRAFRKISQKRIDFVVCDGESMKVRCLVELDDSSHEAGRDQARDTITAQAGYRTVRVRAARRYDIDGLRRRVLDIPAEQVRLSR